MIILYKKIFDEQYKIKFCHPDSCGNSRQMIFVSRHKINYHLYVSTTFLFVRRVYKSTYRRAIRVQFAIVAMKQRIIYIREIVFQLEYSCSSDGRGKNQEKGNSRRIWDTLHYLPRDGNLNNNGDKEIRLSLQSRKASIGPKRPVG